jgi:hypothetical protein
VIQLPFGTERPLQTPQREWISNELKRLFHDPNRAFSRTKFCKSKGVQNLEKEYKNKSG